MRPFFSISLVAVSWLWVATTGRAQEDPPLELREMTAMGCFSSSESLEDQGYHKYQTSGYCQTVCVKLNKPVLAVADGSNCWCGDLLPAAESKVDDDQCDFPCLGYKDHMCGGDGKWTVLLSGLKPKVSNASPTGASSTDASTSTSAAAVVTVSANVQTVTASTPEPTAVTTSTAPKSSGSSTASKAGIAAGAVIGVLGLCALAGGIFLFVRMRRRRAVEEEYRRNADISAFVGKEGSTSSVSDSRLDPSVMQRRMSDGSIADNQDYSRRILKVTNPDGT